MSTKKTYIEKTMKKEEFRVVSTGEPVSEICWSFGVLWKLRYLKLNGRKHWIVCGKERCYTAWYKQPSPAQQTTSKQPLHMPYDGNEK